MANKTETGRGRSLRERWWLAELGKVNASTGVILPLYAVTSRGGTLPIIRLHSATFAWVTMLSCAAESQNPFSFLLVSPTSITWARIWTGFHRRLAIAFTVTFTVYLPGAAAGCLSPPSWWAPVWAIAPTSDASRHTSGTGRLPGGSDAAFPSKHQGRARPQCGTCWCSLDTTRTLGRQSTSPLLTVTITIGQLASPCLWWQVGTGHTSLLPGSAAGLAAHVMTAGSSGLPTGSPQASGVRICLVITNLKNSLVTSSISRCHSISIQAPSPPLVTAGSPATACLKGTAEWRPATPRMSEIVETSQQQYLHQQGPQQHSMDANSTVWTPTTHEFSQISQKVVRTAKNLEERRKNSPFLVDKF